MVARIKNEIAVGITDEIKAALDLAVQYQGSNPSQYARQALWQRLVYEGFLPAPKFTRPVNSPKNNSEIAPAA